MVTVHIKKNKIPPELLQYFRFKKEGDRWRLRNTLIWHKPNVMPSSVRDRFTVDYEPVFFFSKSKKYFFEPQYEPHETNENRKDGIVRNRELRYDSKENQIRKSPPNKGNVDPHKDKYAGAASHMTSDGWVPNAFYNPLGRNKRCVWKIATKPFSEAHFATFPPALIETPIKSGCPEFICKKCGKAREKQYDVWYEPQNGKGYRTQTPKVIGRKEGKDSGGVSPQEMKYGTAYKRQNFIGYTDCGCNAGWSSGIILDPFMGSGTVALVARALGRQWVGIELNAEYIEIAERRLTQQLLF